MAKNHRESLFKNILKLYYMIIKEKKGLKRDFLCKVELNKVQGFND